MSRRRLIERRRPRPGGYTLVEVVVALLIASIMVTSVFSVAVTSKQSGGKSDRQMIAGQVTRLVTSTLKNYVTGCACDPVGGSCPTTGVGACTVTGPMSGMGSCALGGSVPSCTASWSFNNGAGISDATFGTQYALKYGVHTINGLLPAWFSGAPYNATVTYNVVANTVNGKSVPSVTVNVNWTEP